MSPEDQATGLEWPSHISCKREPQVWKISGQRIARSTPKSSTMSTGPSQLGESCERVEFNLVVDCFGCEFQAF